MTKVHNYVQALTALAICLSVVAVPACAAETDPDGALYQPSEDQLADLQQTLDRAKASDRLALIVLGANWCHDSRALAARLNKSPLKEVIDENYETVIVDVGYYEKGRDVVNQFGVHHYYATPTVLVVDPETRELVNEWDRHQWGNAYRISMDDSVKYFEKWPTMATEEHLPVSAELRELYNDIDEYERQLADRVEAGYAVVGPMLKAYKDGNDTDDFDAKWDELRDFRVEVPKRVRHMRKAAHKRIVAGYKYATFDFPHHFLGGTRVSHKAYLRVGSGGA